jgi:hypothetical protein
MIFERTSNFYNNTLFPSIHHAKVKTLKSRLVASDNTCFRSLYLPLKISVSLTNVSKKTKEHKNAMMTEVCTDLPKSI